MKQLIRRFFGKPNSNRTITDSAADARSSELETLEPRMLFSAGPVEAPDDANPEPEGQEQAAEESVVVNPAAARAAADSVSETESTQEGLAAEQTGLGQSAVPGNQGVRLLEVDDSSGQLNQETLEAIAEAAADRWRATGLTADQEAALDAIDYQVDSLANFVLGEASGHSITVDDNAGGRGWFIDSTPLVDEEFTLGDDGFLTSTLGDAGSGHDLLTVLLHEQGHILGIEDQAANLDPADVMSGTIGAGLRRLPGEDQADGALPGSIEDTHFAISTLGTPASVAAEQTPSMSYTLADGDDRLLVVMILDEGGFGVTAVSFGSTPLTMLGEVAGSNFQILQVWYKEMGDSLTSTTDTITATFTDNLPNDDYAGVIAAVAYEGVNQATPVEGFVSSDGTLSTSVTSEVGDLVVGAAYNFGDDLTAGPGQTAIHTHNVIDVSPGSGDANFMTSSEAGAAAVTMSYTAPSLTDAVTMAFNINSDAPPSLDPEIKIEHTPSAVEIPDGDTTPTGAGDEGTYYDSVDTATGMVTRTFTITNTGNADLTLTGATPVSVDDNTHFSVTQPALTTLTPLATTTFTVTFNPNADGLQSTTVHVASDDGDEADYDFLVQGIGTTLSPTNITQLGSEGSISNDGAGFGTTTTLTLPFTVEAGTNRLLVVFGHEKETAADAEITGVTFQSTGGSPTVFPLTGLNLAIEAVDGSGLQQTEIYHLALGSGGQITGEIVMSISDVSGDNDATMLTAVAYENVDQTAPVDGFVSTNGSASNSALNVVSEAGDRVVSVHANRAISGAAANPTPDAAQTVIHDLDAVQGASYLVSSTEPGGVLIDTLHSWNSAPEPSQPFVTVAMNINAAPPEDYGDAPDSYLTLGASGGAAHIIDANLFMGAAAPDGDSDGFGDGTEDNVNLATDDDTETATPDDEDGVASFAALSAADTSYSVDVTVSNNTGTGGTLFGWIDFDGDGIFQADEGASVAVGNGTTGGTATLNWTGIGGGGPDITDGATFARFRLTTDGTINTATPGGAALDGEVEDYALTIALAPTGTTDVSVAGGVLTIGDNNNEDNDFLVTSDGTTLTIEDRNDHIINLGGLTGGGDGTDTITLNYADNGWTGGIVINGSGGDDSLEIDFGGGTDFDTRAITFNGQGQNNSPNGDELILTGGSFATAGFSYSTENNGTIQLNGQGLITYTGLEPVTSTITAADVTLTYTSALAETITVTDNGGDITVDSDVGGESTNFLQPTNSLTITGGATDDLAFAGAIDLGTAAFTVSAIGTVALNQDLTSGAQSWDGTTVNHTAGTNSTSGQALTLASTADTTYTFGGTGVTLNADSIMDGAGTSTINLEIDPGGTDSTDITVDDFNTNSLNGGNAVTYTRSGGTLTVNNNLRLGGESSGDGNHKGSLTQSGGAVTVGNDLLFGGVAAGNNEGGTYNLDGGTLDVTGDIIEGASGAANSSVDSAQLQIDGGALTVGGDITVQRFAIGQDTGQDGSYTAAAGQTITSTGTTSVGANAMGALDLTAAGAALNSANAYVGEGANGNGTVTVDNGSTWTVTQWLRIGNSGTGVVNVNSGTLDVQGSSGNPRGIRLGELASGNGTLNIGVMGGGGGTADPIVNNSGGNFETAVAGTGVVNMHSGTLNVLTNNLIVGQAGGSDATFNLFDGLVDIQYQLRVGNAGKGLFEQSGGTVNVGTILDIGNAAGADGTYRMTDGILNAGDWVASDIKIGNFNNASAVALMEIIEGTVNASRSIRIADTGADSSGTLIVGDGTTNPIVNLNTAKSGNLETADDGTGTFTFRSGTITENDSNLITGQAVGSEITAVIGGFGTAATLDLTGGNGLRDWNTNRGHGIVSVLDNGQVDVGRDLNLGNNADADSGLELTIDGGTVRTGLTSGGDVDYRASGNRDEITVKGAGTFEVGNNFLMNRGDSGKLNVEGTGNTFTVAGSYNQDATSALTFTMAGSGVSSIDVTGAANLGDGILNVDFTASGLTSSLTLGDIVLIDSASRSGTFAAFAEGATVQSFADGTEYQITYTYDAATGAVSGGNDVALVTVAESQATIDGGGNLVIEDTLNTNTADDYTVSMNGTNVRIVSTNSIYARDIPGATQVNSTTIDVPEASIGATGKIIFNGGDGDDKLTVDLGDTGGLFGKEIEFNGQGQDTSPNGDTLSIVDSDGGAFATADYNYSNANDGNIAIAGNSTITYTGLEPVTSTITATDVTLNYTSGAAETITVTDSGATLTVNSTQGETTTFNQPSGSLTITGAADDTVEFATALTMSGTDLTLDTAMTELSGSINLGAGDLAFDGDVTQVASGTMRLTAASIAFNGDTTLRQSGSDTFEMSAASGGVTNAAGKLFDINGGRFRLVSGTEFVNNGNMETGLNLALPIFADGNAANKITNNGTFTHNGTQIRLYLEIVNNGTLTVENPSGSSEIAFQVPGSNGPGGKITNNGILNITEASARFDLSGSIVNATGGVINSSGASVTFAENLTLTNQSGGTVNFDGGTVTIDDTTFTNNSGGILNLNDGSLALSNGGSATSAGTTNLVDTNYTIGGTGTFTNDGTLNLTPSGGTRGLTLNTTLANNGTANYDNEGHLTLSGTGSFENGGIFDHAQGSGDDNLVLSSFTFNNLAGGLYEFKGGGDMQITGSGVFNNAGMLLRSGTAGDSAIFNFGATATGTFNNLAGGEVKATGAILHIAAQGGNTSDAGSTWTADGGDIRIGGTWTGTFNGSSSTANGGHVEVTDTSNGEFLENLTVGAAGVTFNITDAGFLWDQSNIITTAGNATNTGTMVIEGGSAKNLTGGGELITGSGGTTTVTGTVGQTGGSSFRVTSGGLLEGTGTINAAVTVDPGGTLAPGLSPGVISSGSIDIDGNYNVDVAGFGVAGNANGHDQEIVTGTVDLDTGTSMIVMDITGLTAAEMNANGGTELVIIDNNLADAVIGNFSNALEGSEVASNVDGTLLDLVITYHGGTGNDVSLVAGNLTTRIFKSGNDLIIEDINDVTNDQLTVSVSGGNLIVTEADTDILIDAQGAFDGATGDLSNSVTIALTTFSGNVILRTVGGDDTMVFENLDLTGTQGLTVEDGTGTDTVTFQTAASDLNNGSVDVTADSIVVNAAIVSGTNGDVTLNANGTDVTISANVTTAGTGAVDVDAARRIQVFSGATVSTVNGGIDMEANAGGVSGNFIGIDLNNGTVQSAGSGTIDLDGTGATPAPISMEFGWKGGGDVIGSSGAITVDGQGGTSTGGDNWGVLLDGAGSTISSGGGNISVNGTGGGTGSGSRNFGVSVDNGAQIAAAGSGTVAINGTGGGVSDNNDGVVIELSATVVTVANGDLTINGTAGAGGAGEGVRLTGRLETTGSGGIIVRGTGSSTGSTAQGILIQGDGQVESTASVKASAGTINLEGTGGGNAGSENWGVAILNTTSFVRSAAGNITLTGTGGGSGGGVDHNQGVHLNGTTIESTGTTTANAATITIDGTGSTAGTLNDGVRVNATVRSVAGDIEITGTGGAGNGSDGVDIAPDVSTIETTGTGANAGDITITGTSNSSASTAEGIEIGNAGTKITTADGDINLLTPAGIHDGVRIADAQILSTNGDILITTDKIEIIGNIGSSGTLTITPDTAGAGIGVGGGSGLLNITDAELLFLQDGFSSITIGDTAAGMGAVDVDSSTFRDDVHIVGGSIAVTELSLGSDATDVTLTARTGAITDGGDGGSGNDVTAANVTLNAAGDIGSDTTGDEIALAADTITTDTSGTNSDQFLSEDDNVDIASFDAGSGIVTLQADGEFDLGTNTVADGSFVEVEDGATLDINGATDTIAGVTVNDGGTLKGDGTIVGPVTVNDGGTGTPGSSPGVIATGNLTLNTGSVFFVELDGTAGPGAVNGHDQYDVTGTVTIDDATLSLDEIPVGYTPVAGDQFVIINNDGADAVMTGTFAGLAEGTYISTNDGGGLPDHIFQITYLGTTGTGNDVVLEATGAVATTNVSIDVGGNLVIDDILGDNTNDNLSISLVGTDYVIEDLDGNPLGTLIVGATQTGLSRVVVPVSLVTGGIDVNTLGGDDAVGIGDLGTLSLNGNLSVDGGGGQDAINQTGDATLAGTGAVDYDAERIYLQAGSSLTTDSGNVDLTGTGATGNGVGVRLRGADITSTSGQVSLTGQGGTTGNFNRGILLDVDLVSATASSISTGGRIDLVGTGGAGGLHGTGVTLIGATVESTGAGPVNLTGSGGSGTMFNEGVAIHKGSTVDAGTGELTVIGTGASTGNYNRGITASASALTSAGGNIVLLGSGGGALTFGVGVELTGIDMDTTDAGTITLRGTGAGGTLGNMGVKLAGASTVDTVDGAILIQGTGNGSTLLNHGIQLAAGSQVAATGLGTVTLNGTSTAGTLLNSGVEISGFSGVTTADGKLTVTGAANGTISLNKGVSLIHAQLRATGAGDIEILGTGSASGGGVYNSGINMSGGAVNSANGSITMTGTGGDGTTLNEGVRIVGATVRSTGGGTLSLTGGADSGTTGVYNSGLYLLSVTLDSNGTIGVTGTGGGGTLLNHGIYMQNIGSAIYATTNTNGTAGAGNMSEDETGNFF